MILFLAQAVDNVPPDWIKNALMATGGLAATVYYVKQIFWGDKTQSVKIEDKLHDRFAGKDEFHEHCRDNEKQREKLHGRIDDVVNDYNRKFQNLPGEIVALLRHTGALK